MRGFALFGILLVNMELYSHPVQQLVLGHDELATKADRLAVWAIDLFADSKIYPVFSFLFGLGLAMKMQRLESQDSASLPFWLRRMFILFCIGIAHAFLLWVGDILMLYALLGTVAVVFFRRRSQRTLLLGAVGILAVTALFRGGLTAVAMLDQATPARAAEVLREATAKQASLRSAAEQAELIYVSGTFGDLFSQRLQDLSFTSGGIIFLAANVFAMFLLGLYAGRRGVFQDLAAHTHLIRCVCRYGLGLGLLASLAYMINAAVVRGEELTWADVLIDSLHTIGAPVLALGYIASITLWLQSDAWRVRLQPLAAVGRMALTNYLLQSLVATTLFYGYGFGLFGSVGPALGLLITIAIFAVQVPLSVWWLGHFQFGPVEWVWRSLTYLHCQPIRERQEQGSVRHELNSLPLETRRTSNP
jgi:uncharacterized protein